MPSWEFRIGSVKIKHPLMPAAGLGKSVDDAREQSESAVSMVVMGSYTPLPREGNSGRVTAQIPLGFLNSIGLKNPGSEWMRKNLPEMVSAAHDADKPLCVSVAAFTPEDYGFMAALALEGSADLIELNLGCPNVLEDGRQHCMASFDPDIVGRILDRVTREMATPNVIVKLSPFSDPMLLIEIDKIVSGFEMVRAVSAMNTFPNGLWLEADGRRRIDANDGLAGYSGPGVLPIALGQVAQHRTNLPDRIRIIGMGGVYTSGQAVRMLRAGADGVGVGQNAYRHGMWIFDGMLTGMESMYSGG